MPHRYEPDARSDSEDDPPRRITVNGSEIYNSNHASERSNTLFAIMFVNFPNNNMLF